MPQNTGLRVVDADGHFVAGVQEIIVHGGTVSGQSPIATITVIEGTGNVTASGSFTVGHLVAAASTDGKQVVDGGAIPSPGTSLSINDGTHTVAAVVDLTFETGVVAETSTGHATYTPPAASAPVGTSALIASAIAVDLNATGDTPMTMSAFATGKFFVVDYALITNPSIDL